MQSHFLNKRVLTVCIFLLLTVTVTGCTKSISQTRSGAIHLSKMEPVRRSTLAEYQVLSQQLGNNLPDGWELLESVKTYTPESLYEIINGSAELYLSYDVVGLTHANLGHKKDPDKYIDISIYDMGSVSNAFGIFSVERAAEHESVSLGRLAYWSEGGLFIWHGDYYLLIVLAEDTAELRKIGIKSAQSIIAQLNDPGKRAPGLDALPQEGLKAETIRFFRVDAMGLHLLKNTYVADYQVGKTALTTFYSRGDSIQAMAEQFNAYLDHVKKYGKIGDEINRGGTKYVLCDMGEGTDVIFLRDNLMGGVVSASHADTAVEHLKTFSDHLTRQ
mgnify:CR=1 FL=1|jgi:hypothetical protein